MIFKILNKSCGNLGQILGVVMSEIFYVNLKCAFQCKLVVSSYEDDIVIEVISKVNFNRILLEYRF